jgi:hypothetical protein
LRVSLLYRKHVPASMQSPSSASLAALLGVAGFANPNPNPDPDPDPDPDPNPNPSPNPNQVAGFDEAELLQGSCLRPPPALYHYAGPEQLRALAARGWFDVVLLTVWFQP